VGALARVSILGSAGRAAWTGAHRPVAADLRPLFEVLAVASPSALIEASESGAESLDALAGCARWLGAIDAATVRLELLSTPVPVRVRVLAFPAGPEGLGWGRSSQAAELHDAAHRLRALGLATSRPLGFLERARAPRRAPSFLVLGDSDAPTLAALLRSRPRAPGAPEEGKAPAISLAARRRLVVLAGAFLRSLHAAGWVHPALREADLLVEDGELVLAGLRGLARARLSGARRGWALGRLLRSSELPLSLTDGLRFAKSYLRHEPDARQSLRALYRDAVLGERGTARTAAVGPGLPG
jgi:hypothetical protein